MHGCRAELEELLATLGYEIDRDAAGRPAAPATPAAGAPCSSATWSTAGPDTPGVLRLVMGMVAAGDRVLRGRQPREQAAPGAARPQRQASATAWPSRWRSWTPSPRSSGPASERFIDGLISHYVLDGGRLVVAHAGLIERYHGRASGRVREFCLYGQTTGETDEYGLPVRYPWANEYRGRAMVVYGHTPVPAAEWVNNTLCLDTGCVFGGRLTALRYPERELVSVPAARGLLRAGQAVPLGRPAPPPRPGAASPTCSTSPTCPGPA